jgi:hypothetical protein
MSYSWFRDGDDEDGVGGVLDVIFIDVIDEACEVVEKVGDEMD